MTSSKRRFGKKKLISEFSFPRPELREGEKTQSFEMRPRRQSYGERIFVRERRRRRRRAHRPRAWRGVAFNVAVAAAAAAWAGVGERSSVAGKQARTYAPGWKKGHSSILPFRLPFIYPSVQPSHQSIHPSTHSFNYPYLPTSLHPSTLQSNPSNQSNSSHTIPPPISLNQCNPSIPYPSNPNSTQLNSTHHTPPQKISSHKTASAPSRPRHTPP